MQQTGGIRKDDGLRVGERWDEGKEETSSEKVKEPKLVLAREGDRGERIVRCQV